MKFTNSMLTSTLAAAAAITAGVAGIVGTPIAAADDLTTTTLGNEARLTDGNVVQGWTISGLKASSDVIPYSVAGTLWEATATDQALQGSATPIVSNLNARSSSGETYRVLFGVATPQGVNPSTLGEGQKTTGKVYFDVVGDSPNSVVYNAGGHDLLVWVPAPPPARGGTTSVTPYTGGSTTPPTGAAATPAAEATPKPAAVPGTPAAATGPGAALPAGSAGTPIPAGSAGTPLAAPGSEGTPVAGTPAAPGAPVTPAAPAAPAIAGTQGAPQPAAIQEAPAAPAAAGSQGTPLPNGPSSAAPITTVVVPPPA